MRWSLIVTAAAAWALVFWLGSHRSQDPTVLGRWSSGYFGIVAAAAAVALLLTAAHLPPIYRRLHAARRGILAFVAISLVTLAVLETLVRIADPLGISYYEEAKRYHLEKIADDDLVYRHRPGYRATYFGVDYEFNEIGLRDRPIGTKAPGEFRVLVLGDSVALGSGVETERTFVRLLEDRLSKRTGRPVRTINAGVGSYNTVQEFAFLKLRGKELAPDLVLLVYVDNDMERNLPPFDPWSAVSIRGKSPPEALERIAWMSWIYRVFAHIGRHGGAGAPAAPDRASEGWRESMDHLGRISDLCGELDAPFATFLWRLRASPATDALWDGISGVAARKGFAVGDIAKAFEGVDPRSVMLSVVDVHANAEGQRLVAAMLDDFLAAKGLLD